MSSPFYKYLNSFALKNVSYVGMCLITGYTKQEINFSVVKDAKIEFTDDIVAKIPESLAWLLDDVHDGNLLSGNMYKNYIYYNDSPVGSESKINITNVLQLYVILNYDISDYRLFPSWEEWTRNIISNHYLRRISGIIKPKLD